MRVRETMTVSLKKNKKFSKKKSFFKLMFVSPFGFTGDISYVAFSKHMSRRLKTLKSTFYYISSLFSASF